MDENDEEIQYKKVDGGAITLVEPKTTKFRGYQIKYSITVITNVLLTYEEIQKIGYQIALSSKAEVVWIWFKRNSAPNGVNIVTQQWFKEDLKSFFGDIGKKYGKLLLSENRDEGYVCRDYYSAHPNMSSKHLPVSENALTVKLDIRKSANSLTLYTNLLKGTKLYVTYRVNGRKEKSLNLIVQGQKTRLPLDGYQTSNHVSCDVILIASTLQDKLIRDRYGIDYENLTGDFIQRSKMDPIVCGLKNFTINHNDY